jgi:hypothetical protein
MPNEKSPEVTTSIPKINQGNDLKTEAFIIGKGSQELANEGFAQLSEEEREIVSSLQPKTAMLVGIVGAAKGFRFLLDQEKQVIGRSQDSDIFLDDITVSRQHGLIERTLTGFDVVDTNSLNGIYHNHEILTERKALYSGDELQIGKYKFTFFAEIISFKQK